MRISVLLFAAGREAAGGAAEVAVEVPAAGATAAHVQEALLARGGALARVAARARLAVNQAFARPETPVSPADEVALIPPVGGG